MSYRSAVLVALVAGGVALATAQTPPAGQAGAAAATDARWLRATDAWEAGWYPAALEELRALMKPTVANDYLEPVALLTGELCTPTERRVTPAERNARKRSFSNVPGFASSVISQSAASFSRARMSPSSRSMPCGENRLGVPPPMKTL